MDKKKVKIAAASAISVATVVALYLLARTSLDYAASRLEKALAGK